MGRSSCRQWELEVDVAHPPLGAFQAALGDPAALDDLERLRTRFGSSFEWSHLEPVYLALTKQKNLAAEEARRVEAEQRQRDGLAQIKNARAALAAENILAARRALEEAERLGVEDKELKKRIEEVSLRDGNAAIAKATMLARSGRVAEAQLEANLAKTLGVQATPALVNALDSAINKAREREGTQHMAEAIKLAKRGRFSEGDYEAEAAKSLGFTDTTPYLVAQKATLLGLADGPCGTTARGLDYLLATNEFFQQAWVLQARRTVGAEGSVGQLMGLAGASSMTLLKGSTTLDDWGFSPTLRRQVFKSRMGSIASFVAAYDNELKSALADARDLGDVDPRLVRRGLSLSKTFSSDTAIESFAKCAKLLKD